MNVNIRPLSDAEARDIAITAAEGGVNYWARIIDYDPIPWMDDSTFDPSFPFFTLVEDEEPDNPVSITPAMVRLGFERTLAAPRDNGGWAAQNVAFMSEEDRVGEIDSVAADIIIQYAVLGDLVYG